MKTTRQDDRTPEQMKTYTYLVTATDRFMSGWGGASGGASKCAWACNSWSNAQKLFDWVSNRSEMKYVNITTGKWYPNAAHIHIYVADETHPALRK